MKAFLIFLALVVGLGIFLITSYSKIAEWVISDVVVQEGAPEGMKDANTKDENAFAVKYQPFLERRVMVGRFAEILAEDYFLDLAKDTLDRYTDTSLQTSEDYEYFLLKRAVILDQRVQTAEAWVLYRRHQTLFPGSRNAPMVRTAVNRLLLKYGYQ
jgi:hypothetical protein